MSPSPVRPTAEDRICAGSNPATPNLFGFLGKFYVFASAIHVKMYKLVAIGMINSVIAVYYYFRIVHKMFFQEPVGNSLSSEQEAGRGSLTEKVKMSLSIRLATVFSAGAVLLLGIFPQTVVSWIQRTAKIFP